MDLQNNPNLIAHRRADLAADVDNDDDIQVDEDEDDNNGEGQRGVGGSL